MTAAALSEEDEEERSGADKNTQADFFSFFVRHGKVQPSSI